MKAVLLVVFVSSHVMAVEFQAGFDCEKAEHPVEKSICSDALLALGDQEMSRLYAELLSKLSLGEAEVMRTGQREWLRKRNKVVKDGAVDKESLYGLYSDRVEYLAESLFFYKEPDFRNSHLQFGFQSLPRHSELTLGEDDRLMEGKEFVFYLTVDSVRVAEIFVGFWSMLTDQGIEGHLSTKLEGVSYLKEHRESSWDKDIRVVSYSMERGAIFRNYWIQVIPEYADWFEDNWRFY